LATRASPPKNSVNPKATSKPDTMSAPVYALKTQSPNANARAVKTKKIRHKNRRLEIKTDLERGFISASAVILAQLLEVCL
jgi:hypothetical protein